MTVRHMYYRGKQTNIRARCDELLKMSSDMLKTGVNDFDIQINREESRGRNKIFPVFEDWMIEQSCNLWSAF